MEQRRRLFEPLLAPKGTLRSVDQFKQFAAYNKWANARLYAAVLDLPEPAYRLHIGVFFGGLHGTLNHLLLTDRLWLKRLTGEGDELCGILGDEAIRRRGLPAFG